MKNPVYISRRRALQEEKLATYVRKAIPYQKKDLAKTLEEAGNEEKRLCSLQEQPASAEVIMNAQEKLAGTYKLLASFYGGIHDHRNAARYGAKERRLRESNSTTPRILSIFGSPEFAHRYAAAQEKLARRKKGLEGTLILAFIFFIVGATNISITGYAITEPTITSSQTLGTLLFLVGLGIIALRK